MAAKKLDKTELVALAIAALRLAGWQTLILADGSPTQIRLLKDGVPPIDAWLYIWNLTEGGRSASRPNERRIQATGIGDAFKTSPRTKTLILGWSVEFDVFAAFDHNYHAGTFGSSPSLQIDRDALEHAVRDGIGVYGKATGELALGVRPDLLGFYIEQMRVLHSAGIDPAERDVLKQMATSPLDVSDSDVASNVAAPRRRVMTHALRLLRDRRFSENVLRAYSHRCAFCEVQLNLLDAAHILPVAHPHSTDLVNNGVALCALHHRAYDSALVTFDPTYTIQLSKSAITELKKAKRVGGLPAFEKALRPNLLLPAAATNHPLPAMIIQANQLRGWV